MMQVVVAATALLVNIIAINAGTNFDATWTRSCRYGMLANIFLVTVYCCLCEQATLQQS